MHLGHKPSQVYATPHVLDKTLLIVLNEIQQRAIEVPGLIYSGERR